MSETEIPENQNETPMDQTPAPRDPRTAQNAERKIESADDQSVDWQKKFEDSERVNRQLRAKMNAMAKRINKKMKLAKLEKDKTKDKLADLFGKNSFSLEYHKTCSI